MQIKGFSRRELISILEIIDGARRCRSEKDLGTLLLKAKDLVCADHAVCGRGRMQGGAITEVTMLVNANYPAAWLSSYMEDRLFEKDPLVKYHSRFTMPRSWSDIIKACDDPDSRTVVERAREFGLAHGISGGIYSPRDEELSLFVFAGDQDRFGTQQKRVLDMLILHLNRALDNIADKGGFEQEELEKVRII